jgi:Mg2+/citrate symporter
LIGLAAMFLTPFVAAAWLTMGLADVWLGFREREQTS